MKTEKQQKSINERVDKLERDNKLLYDFMYKNHFSLMKYMAKQEDNLKSHQERLINLLLKLELEVKNDNKKVRMQNKG